LTSVTSGGASIAYAATSAGEVTADTNGNTLGYNAAQELTSLTPTTGPASSYTYDDNGSRRASTVAASGGVPAATTSYAYDPLGDLASVAPSAGAAITYNSDGDGLRQTRTVGSSTTDFTWDVQGSLPLLLDDGTHSYLYGPSSAPFAQVDDSTGAIQYLNGDLIGSTRLITNSSGTAVGTTEYDAYGNRTNHTGTADSAIGYSGNLTDIDTGLVYLRARDYDPATAQFITVDPNVDVTNQPYAYVGNEPTIRTDPTGLCAWDPFGCNSLDKSIDTAQNQEWGNIVDFLSGLCAGMIGQSSSPLPCFGPDNGAFTAGNDATDAILIFITWGTGGDDDPISQGTRPAPTGPQINEEFQAAGGGRSGQNIKNLQGPPNSVIKGSPGRVYVTNKDGQVIQDITANRVKNVIPGKGFVGGKITPSSEQLQWIERLWGN
jgi:RHS repeat-associated protein